MNNRIQGAGSVMKARNGTLKLQGALANTFTGGFQLSLGTVQLGKPAGIMALPGPVTNHPGFPNTIAGTILWAAPNQIADTASISRVANLNLVEFDDTLASATLRGGSISTGAGTLTLTGGMTCEDGPFGAAPFPLTISGNLAFSGAGIHLLDIADSPASPDLQCDAVDCPANRHRRRWRRDLPRHRTGYAPALVLPGPSGVVHRERWKIYSNFLARFPRIRRLYGANRSHYHESLPPLPPAVSFEPHFPRACRPCSVAGLRRAQNMGRPGCLRKLGCRHQLGGE